MMCDRLQLRHMPPAHLYKKINYMSLDTDSRKPHFLRIDPVHRRDALTRNIATCLSPFRPDKYRLVVSVTCPTSTRPSSLSIYQSKKNAGLIIKAKFINTDG
ncbi:hypothetical protein Hanom_Chr10g00932081 [Helianthus anomalus]